MTFYLHLYRAPSNAGPPQRWQQNHAAALGSAQSVRLRLAQLFPQLEWQQGAGASLSAWSAAGSPLELHLHETEPGVVHFVNADAPPSTLREIMSALQLTHCCAAESGEMRDPFAVDDRWQAL